jgi:hypothetical protein
MPGNKLVPNEVGINRNLWLTSFSTFTSILAALESLYDNEKRIEANINTFVEDFSSGHYYLVRGLNIY